MQMFVVHVVVIIGGVDMMTQALQLAKKPHIVIGNYNGHVNITRIFSSSQENSWEERLWNDQS